MPTILADKLLQSKRILERRQIKEFIYKLSTAEVPGPKAKTLNQKRPSYLRYIEYV